MVQPPPPPATPPLHTRKITIPPIPEVQKPPKEIETLPQIELNLPKRPIRERLGVKEVPKVPDVREKEKTKETAKESPERLLITKSFKVVRNFLNYEVLRTIKYNEVLVVPLNITFCLVNYKSANT